MCDMFDNVKGLKKLHIHIYVLICLKIPFQGERKQAFKPMALSLPRGDVCDIVNGLFWAGPEWSQCIHDK